MMQRSPSVLLRVLFRMVSEGKSHVAWRQQRLYRRHRRRQKDLFLERPC